MATLRPFFLFYGGKWRAARRYPPPANGIIIEPFAGAAGYATRYPDRDVILVEKDPRIVKIWRYLIRVSVKDFLRLPDIRAGQTVDDLGICDGAKYLIGFWVNKGVSAPCKVPSAWMRRKEYKSQFWGPKIRERIASQLDAIRHWSIIYGNYWQAPNLRASWFIDPPYSKTGQHYDYSDINYKKLAKWCEQRRGQIIVCEQRGAKWLPFKKLGSIKTNVGGGGISQEVVWTCVR